MPTVVQVLITGEEGDDLGEAIGEQMIMLNARYWDTSTMTLLRILGWLNTPREGQQRDEQALSAPSGTKDLGSESIWTG